MRLFRAIILQAFQDLGSKSKTPESLYYKEEAKNWLLSNSPWFYEVCDHADFHPDAVRKIAFKIIEDGGLAWRAAAGKGKRYAERKRYREMRNTFTI